MRRRQPVHGSSGVRIRDCRRPGAAPLRRPATPPLAPDRPDAGPSARPACPPKSLRRMPRFGAISGPTTAPKPVATAATGAHPLVASNPPGNAPLSTTQYKSACGLMGLSESGRSAPLGAPASCRPGGKGTKSPFSKTPSAYAWASPTSRLEAGAPSAFTSLRDLRKKCSLSYCPASSLAMLGSVGISNLQKIIHKLNI